MFFTSTADAYSKVLVPPKGLKDKLGKSAIDMSTVLDRCLHRLEWERSQEQARKKAENEIEQKRLQMAMIDWHDFVVVETIDFADYDEDQDLPPPMTLEEVIRRSKMLPTLEREEYVDEVEMEMDEEEVQLVEEGTRDANVEENVYVKSVAIREEGDPPMLIVKNWKRLEERIQAERDSTKYVVCPITGELIPINEMSEHMRISLIDPKYKEQKERMFANIRETTLAQDDEISRNIIRLAQTRPDIFAEYPTPPNTIKYSTPTSAVVVALPPPRPPMVNMIPQVQPPTPPMPQMPGQQNLMVNCPPMPPLMTMNSHNLPVPPSPVSQFTPLGAPRPFVPLMMSQLRIHIVPPPPMPQGMLPPPPVEEAPLPEEPEPKRQKLDESVLIPEEQFLAQNSEPARINVSVPNTEEGNLKGQVLEITVQSLSETIGSLKENISGEIQLPANKQKLSGKAGFLKDNLSLAYYNVASGETLTVSLRERGGRKR
ncbi:putative splicing factor 3a subunit 1 [Nicotiana attenuata]|uniref:Splicing factor 3a subunit 1 n=1 Tax=Nicotiana attenuata TaxID=49451 RepID=A0A314KU10_NICAT|nr:putative splicing factor 3a subunit 1 [Nicotiana attenuata]